MIDNTHTPVLSMDSARPSIRGLLPVGRALLAAVSIGLAFWGQRIVAEAQEQRALAPPTASWVMFGVAALLFAVAAGWPPRIVPRLRPALPAPFLSTLREKWRVQFIVPLALALFCSGAAIPLFFALNADTEDAPPGWLVNTGSWLLYIASLVLFGIAFVVWERKRPVSGEQWAVGSGQESAQDPQSAIQNRGALWATKIEWLLMGGLFGLALLLRLVDLDNVPPGLWFDEAQNGLVAKALLSPDAYHATFIMERTQMGALYFYALGAVLNLFGDSIWQLRLLPALSGSAIVPMLYLLGARLFGWRVGLAAAGLLAVSAWHITFSRFGIASMSTVALDVAVYLCLMQGLRTGRLGYYALGGVLLGLALQMYYVSRLVPVVLLVLAVYLLITERLRFIRAIRAGAVTFAVGALLAFVPVGTFAVQNWETYNSRVAEASIFSVEGSEGKPDAFYQSLSRHAFMFNYIGDVNGRHNLPGAPMLDWVTGALFFVGLGSCVLRAWRWQYFFPALWFVAAMSGGVLSLLFEAPQSHRTLEASVVTALLAGIFLGEAWALLSRAVWGITNYELRITNFQKARIQDRVAAANAQRAPATTLPVRARPTQVGKDEVRNKEASRVSLSLLHPSSFILLTSLVSLLGVLAVVWWAGSLNVERYFRQQATHTGVWRDMSAIEKAVALTARRFSQTHDIWVTPTHAGLPPTQYLAPDSRMLDWPGMYILPLNPEARRDVILMLDAQEAHDLAYIAHLYPNATFEPFRVPGPNPTPLMWTIYIPASDISALLGVYTSLYDDGATTPREERTSHTISFDWGSADATAGTVRLSTSLKVEQFAGYTFQWQAAGADSPGDILVDGYSVSSGDSISLSVGLHSIVVTDTVTTLTTGGGVSQLMWKQTEASTPFLPLPAERLFDPRQVEPRGLTGLFRPGTGFDEPPTESRIDPSVAYYFHFTPLGRPYTAEWIGKIWIPEQGVYTFGTEQISRTRLLVDGAELVNNTGDNAYVENTVPLTTGWHDLRLLFEDLNNYSHVYLYWTPPGRERTIIPSAFLWPQIGQYPAPGERPPLSGPLPTLDQADGRRVPPERIVGAAPEQQPAVVPPTAISNQPPLEPPQQPPQQQPESTRGEPIEPVFVLGEEGEPIPGPLAGTADDAGNIYVYTDRDGKVRKFDGTGKLLTSWQVRSASGGPLTEGSAMLVHEGQLLLLDAEASDVITFGLDGGEASTRTHLCACYYPRGFSASRDGNLWVADTGNGRVLKITPDGNTLAVVGEMGSGPGQFLEPAGVWESPDGTLYVTDIGNGRVQSFDALLTPQHSWPVGQSVAREGTRLVGDGEGNLLVTQEVGNAVVMYDPQGKELRRWVWTPPGREVVLTPSTIVRVGDARFLVLFPRDGLGLVFSPRR